MYWKILLLLGLGLVACGEDDASSSESTTVGEKVHTSDKRKIYQVMIDNLRLRRTPDLSGIVLRKLDLGTKLEYLDEQTNFTTSIEMGGERLSEPWFRVRISEGDTGWVHGACIKFLTEISIDTTLKEEKEAKKVAYLEETVEQMQPPELEEVALRGFHENLSSIRSEAPYNIGAALQQFKQFASRYSKSPASIDAAFVQLWNFRQEQVADINRRQNLRRYNHLAEEIRRYGSADMSKDEQAQAWASNGLAFGLEEGSIILKEDADFWVRETYRYVSDPMRHYLDQYQREARVGWVQSGELKPSAMQLAEWVAYWERFLLNYPYASLREDAERRLRKAQKLLLEGSAKNPAFDSSGNLKPNFRAAYQFSVKQSSEEGLQEDLRDYINALEENNFQDNKNLRRKRRAIYQAKTPRE